MPDAGMEISLYRDPLPEASSAALASMLLGKHTSPTQAASAERLLRVQEALNTLDPIDREVLALRHFQQLPGPTRPRCWGSARRRATNATFVLLSGSRTCSRHARGGEEL